jgi:hypothetical protein
LALAVSSDDQRLFEQHRLDQIAAAESLARERAVPETEEHERVGCLRLEWDVVGHWKGENTAAAAKSKP